MTYIHLRGIGSTTSCSHFRGNINSRTNAPGYVACIRVRGSLIHRKLSTSGQPKVSNLDIFYTVRACTNEDILRLEVAVDNVEAVDMGKTLKHLAEETPDLLRLLEKVTRYQITKSLAKC